MFLRHQWYMLDPRPSDKPQGYRFNWGIGLITHTNASSPASGISKDLFKYFTNLIDKNNSSVT